MTPEQIIEMAKQAGIDWDAQGGCATYRVNLSELQRFTQLVRDAALDEVIGAIDALEDCRDGCEESHNTVSAVAALRAALAEPAVEPAAWLYDFTIVGDDEVYTNWVTQDPTEVGKEVVGIRNVRPLYTSPQPPAEVPLLQEDVFAALWSKAEREDDSWSAPTTLRFARAVEQAVRQKAGLK